MKVITTREIRSEAKLYFELAEKEQVAVKRGKKYVNLWVKSFLEIPAEFRCNPFEISPSGDLYYADKRNVERLKEAIDDPEQRKVSRTIRNKAELKAFFDGAFPINTG